MKLRFNFRVFFCVLAFMTSVTQAHALCDEERAATVAAIAAIAEKEKEVLQNCGEFRVCKGEARISKMQCKQNLADEIFACMQDCRTMNGREKGHCKSQCRGTKKIGKATCRNLRLGGTVDCRNESPQCVGLWGDRAVLILEGVTASAAFAQCLRKRGEEAETEEEREDVEDAETAGDAG